MPFKDFLHPANVQGSRSFAWVDASYFGCRATGCGCEICVKPMGHLCGQSSYLDPPVRCFFRNFVHKNTSKPPESTCPPKLFSCDRGVDGLVHFVARPCLLVGRRFDAFLDDPLRPLPRGCHVQGRSEEAPARNGRSLRRK